jgi:hypothetical protein
MELAGSSRARGGRGGGDAGGGQHQAGGSEPVDSSLLQVHLCSYLRCVLRCHPQAVLSGCEKDSQNGAAHGRIYFSEKKC